NREQYAEAERTLHQGLERAELFPGNEQLAADLRAQLRVAERGQLAQMLHGLAEQVRFRYGIDPPAGAEADSLVRNVRPIWEDGHLLLARDSSALLQKAEDRIPTDLLELIGTWAEVRTRLAAGADVRAAQEETLAILDEARAAFGPSYIIDRLRRSLAERLERPNPPSEEPSSPHSARDHYELGRSLLRESAFRAAAEQFRLSLDQRPQDFWPNFYLGLCEYNSERFEAAVDAFAICIALEPDRAECY